MNPQVYYQDTITQEQQELLVVNSKIQLWSWLRLAAILLAIPVIYGGFSWHVAAGISAIVLALVGFIAAVLKQQVHIQRQAYLSQSINLWENEINNINNYTNIYYDGNEFIDSRHPYTYDLDVFGRKSLFQMISRTRTYHGIRLLADWFINLRSVKDIKATHSMVEELSQKTRWRHEFALHLWPLMDDQRQAQYRRVIRLADKPVNLGPTWGWLLGYSRWAYVSVLTLIILFILFPVTKPALIGLLIAHGYLNLHLAKRVNEYHQLLSNLNQELMAYAGALEMAEKEDWRSESMQGLVKRLSNTEGKSAVKQIRELARIGRHLDLRLNMIGGLVFNVLALWDFRQLHALRSWQQSADRSLQVYFDVLGELEAVSSLSTLHYNQPQWALPTVVDDLFTLELIACAHPLIPPDERVGNDFQLSGPGHVDIITGSNMAGKSTFLRSLGVNFILAHLGAPVCAAYARLSPAKLYTSMRIADDVTEHVSTFKAELNRLRLVLEALDRGENVFVLLDEMLRGTNSQDKYQGSRAMIETLLQRGAVGLIATHDLQLAAMEDDYPAQIRNYYFDISVQGSEYRFDYRLKPGRCQTFNASLLLRELGLSV